MAFIAINLLAPVMGLTVVISIWIYRLTLHPLAKFPGPRPAAATSIFALSFDIFARSRKAYIKHFPQWHDTYGPIIRIEPHHLHVRDINAYNQVFRMGTKFDRDPVVYSTPVTKGAFFNKHQLKVAKPHRALYTQYFSRGAVQSLEPMIKQNILRFIAIIENKDAKPVDLSRGFKSLIADTIMHYCFDKPYGALEYPEFKHPMLEDIEYFLDIALLGTKIPKIMDSSLRLSRALPRTWVRTLFKPVAAMLDNYDRCKERIVEMMEKPVDSSTPSIFRAAIDSKTLNADELAADAVLMFIAGTDTTSNALVTGVWGLLNNKKQLRNLQNELRTAIPHRQDLWDQSIDWQSLEKLETLTSVVKESLRLSYGVPGRLPRVVPAEGATLCGQSVPAGTLVSMSCHSYHQNPEYFPDSPDEFKPERWSTESESTDPTMMEKYFIPFSRGSRNCIGTNLAYAQLFYVFAYFFRAFDVESYDTSAKDMDWFDAFTIANFGHLRVIAKKTEA